MCAFGCTLFCVNLFFYRIIVAIVLKKSYLIRDYSSETYIFWGRFRVFDKTLWERIKKASFMSDILSIKFFHQLKIILPSPREIFFSIIFYHKFFLLFLILWKVFLDLLIFFNVAYFSVDSWFNYSFYVFDDILFARLNARRNYDNLNFFSFKFYGNGRDIIILKFNDIRDLWWIHLYGFLLVLNYSSKIFKF